MVGSKLNFVLALAISAALVGIAFAQQAQPGLGGAGSQNQQGQLQQGQSQPGQQAGQARGQQRDRSERTDSQLVTCLLLDNQNEIAAAQLAQQRAQSQQVKQFAEQMIQEHQQFASKLQQHVDRQESRFLDNQQGGQTASRGQQNQQQQGVRQTSAETAAEDGQSRTNFVAIKAEVAQQCRESARRELEQKQGAEFDKCYMGMQVVEHMKMIDHLTVFQKHVSPEVQQVLAEGQRTAQGHLDHAKQLVKSLEGGDRSARQDGPGQR